MKINSFIKKLLFSFLLLMLFINTVKAFSNNLKEVNVIETNMNINNVSLEDNKIIDDIVFTKKDDYIVLEFKIQNNDDYIYRIEDIVDNNTNDNIYITYDYSKEEINKHSDYVFKARIEYKNQLENVKKIDINDLKITIKLSTVDGKDKDIIVNPVTKDSVLYYLVLLILSLIGLILIIPKKKKILGIPLLILIGAVLLPIGIFALEKYEYDVFIKHIEIKGVMLPYNVNFKVLDKDPITKIIKYGEEITELPIINEPGYEFIEWQDSDGNKVDEHTIVTGELNVNAKLGCNIGKRGFITINGNKAENDVNAKFVLSNVYGSEKKINFKVNDQIIYTCNVSQEGNKEIDFIIPKEIWNANNEYFTIEMEFPDASLEENKSISMLAVCIESFEFNI